MCSCPVLNSLGIHFRDSDIDDGDGLLPISLDDVTLSHITPWARSGSINMDNLAILCTPRPLPHANTAPTLRSRTPTGRFEPRIFTAQRCLGSRIPCGHTGAP